MQNKTYLHEPNIGEIHCWRSLSASKRWLNVSVEGTGPLGKSPLYRLENAVARLGDLRSWSQWQGMIAGSFVFLVSVTHGVNVEGAFRPT